MRHPRDVEEAPYAIASFHDVAGVGRYIESISSALWGSISTAFPFCAEFVGTDSESETDCYRGHFKKTRVAAGAGEGWDHESKSGGDFALAFSDVQGDFWVAVFQAKKADEDELELYRSSKPTADGKWRISQLLLLEYGEHVLETLKHEYNINVGSMHWIHYVAYHKSGLYCILCRILLCRS